MSEKTRIIYYALWIAHPVIQTGIAMVMLRRGLHRKFKFFFAYVVTQILIFSLIFPSYLKHNYWAYFYLYWFSNAVSAVLGFQVIHEVFWTCSGLSTRCAIWARYCSGGRTGDADGRGSGVGFDRIQTKYFRGCRPS